MNKTKLIVLMFLLSLVSGVALASEENQDFALMNGMQANAISDTELSTTYGKHFTIKLPNGGTVIAEGTNSPVITHVTLTLGGGAAGISGLPN